jgi:hypothetical protein
MPIHRIGRCSPLKLELQIARKHGDCVVKCSITSTIKCFIPFHPFFMYFILQSSQQPTAMFPLPDTAYYMLQSQPDESAVAFYEEAAVAATAVGVAVDIYAVSPLACGLDMLGCLAGSSGGSMYLYPSLEQAALPQVSFTFLCLHNTN